LEKNKCKKKESDLGKEKKKNEKKSKSYENNTKKKNTINYCIVCGKIVIFPYLEYC
jgi:hypothetical protein